MCLTSPKSNNNKRCCSAHSNHVELESPKNSLSIDRYFRYCINRKSRTYFINTNPSVFYHDSSCLEDIRKVTYENEVFTIKIYMRYFSFTIQLQLLPISDIGSMY